MRPVPIPPRGVVLEDDAVVANDQESRCGARLELLPRLLEHAAELMPWLSGVAAPQSHCCARTAAVVVEMTSVITHNRSL